MQLGTDDNLHFCITGDRAIFMDVGANRYFCLNREADELFRSAVARHDELDPDGAATLWTLALHLGLVPPSADRLAHVATRPDPPTGDLVHCVRRRPKPGQILSTIFDLLAAGSLQRGHDLVMIRRRLAQRRRPVIAPADADAMADIAVDILAAFAWCDLLFGRTDRCLPRALAFIAACNRRGLFPSLVFGVRTNPFAAHCWAQLGPIVLNDSLEHVRVYTPIAVL